MPKTTDENENILENKLKFIGLNLKRLPSFLKDFEPLNFKPTKSHDDINYKIYKYINVLDIEILLTPLDRTADLEQRYKKAEPLCNYLDTKNKKNAEKFETFMEMLDNLNTEDIENLDEEQENLNETIPLKVKYENNYIWQIYYAPESNKYFMLVPTTELTSVALFYLIKKQIESKKNKKKFYIFVPITHMEYSGNLYTSLQITDLENYLWYFTKEWPTIFEIFDKKENSTIRVVGKAKVYDNIVSDYIMNFTQKDECIEKYKLLKALFLLSTSFPNDYSFKTAIGEDGELEFKYNSEVINYENLPEFIKSQAKERTDEIKNIIKEKAKKEALLKKLKKKIDEQNAEYLEKQKQISTFLECKKTFFGKVKYFLNGRKKKEVVSIKRKVNNEEEHEDIQALQKEVVTYEFVEKKVYTIEDIIEIVTRLDSIRKEYKNIELDVKAAELKTENLTRKIKNAKIYIAEINSHKKSIFEFWKFANKDELPGLNEGELDESENDKIGKIFDVDNDMAELGKKIDEIQRVKLSKNEADALFIFRYCSRTMQILNEVKKNSDLTEKQLKEIEKELKQLKKSFKADLKNINLTEFDVFGNILSNEKDNISINNVRHRESKKDKYRILNISKEITLEDFIDNVRNYLKLIKEVLNKIKTNSNLSIYKLSNKKIELENLNIFNINPKNEFKDVDFSKIKEVYLYKVNIKENTPVAFYTNYVFYDNFNKTLPIGMDISTEILFDTFKSKIKETKHEEFNINVYEDEYTSKVLKVNVIEYEGKEYN
jgi:hypothetical protein